MPETAFSSSVYAVSEDNLIPAKETWRFSCSGVSFSGMLFFVKAE